MAFQVQLKRFPERRIRQLGREGTLESLHLRCFLASPNGPVLGTMRDVGRFTGAYRDLRYSWSLAAPRALDGCRHWAGRVLLSTFLNWPALWWIDAPLTFREER